MAPRLHHAPRRGGAVAARGKRAAAGEAGAYRPSFKEAIRREPYFGTVVTGPMDAPRISLKRTSGISASTFRSITDCAAHVMRSACLIQRRRSGHDRVVNWIMRVLVSPQQYRDFAEQCLRWAASAKREEHKNTMLQMAKQWIQRADELERTGTSFRREPPTPPQDDAQQG